MVRREKCRKTKQTNIMEKNPYPTPREEIKLWMYTIIGAAILFLVIHICKELF